MIKIIILSIIICLGTGYLLRQLYNRIRYYVNGPKKCLKVLRTQTKKRIPIILTNVINTAYDPIIGNYIYVCKKSLKKDPAIFPTDQKEVILFINAFFEKETDSYQRFFLASKNKPDVFVILYLPTESVSKYVDYARQMMKERKKEE